MTTSTSLFVDADGARLCTQDFGDPDDPTIVLIHGACASMLCWETELCERLAAHRRHVIRFDSRDTGLSTTYPPGEPAYSLTDMARDVVAILDAYGVEQAHVVGRSMAGGTALVLGVDHPERVASLTFMTTTPGDDDLPPMTPDFLAAVDGLPDFSSPEAVVEHVVSVVRAYAGTSPFFDEEAVRALAREDVERSIDFEATLTNHFLIDFDGPVDGGFDDVAVPSLVIRGSADPVFPIEHGRRLAAHLGADLLVLPEAGHEIPPEHWDLVCQRLAEHTAPVPTRNDRTVRAYEGYARTYARLVGTEPTVPTQIGLRQLHDLVAEGGLVLEVGSGTGHDADFLEGLGTTVRRTDVTRSFIDLQAERGRHVDLLNVVTDDLGGPYDGLVAMCVLIHVEHERLPLVLAKIHASVRSGGPVLVSMREGEGVETSGEWFTALWRQDALETAFEAAGLEPLWHSFDVDDDGERWLTHLLRRRP